MIIICGDRGGTENCSKKVPNVYKLWQPSILLTVQLDDKTLTVIQK